MKKLVLIFSILCSVFVCNAQTFTFKTNEKTFTDEVGVSRTVIGIKAKMIGNIECDLSDSTFNRTFYIEFVLSTGISFGQRNASTDEFVLKIVSTGLNQSAALNTVINICKNLEYGTVLQKYAAAQQLAGSYGYTLKPLNEQ